MFFITLNFKRLINYHIDTLCRVEKFAGKCHNVFRTDLVDDTVEIAGVIELGMGAVVKLQVFRPAYRADPALWWKFLHCRIFSAGPETAAQTDASDKFACQGRFFMLLNKFSERLYEKHDSI